MNSGWRSFVVKTQLEKTLAQVSEMSSWVNIALAKEKNPCSRLKENPHTLRHTSHVKALFPPMQQQALSSGLLQQEPSWVRQVQSENAWFGKRELHMHAYLSPPETMILAKKLRFKWMSFILDFDEITQFLL